MKRAMVLRHYSIRILIGCFVVILMLNVVFCRWPPQAPLIPNPTLDPTFAIDAIEVPGSVRWPGSDHHGQDSTGQ
jgi:hypothetical protein